VGYPPVSASSTSSFRIPDELKVRLEKAAEQMKKRKSWIINRASKSTLARRHQEAFQAEARRQSLAGSSHKWKDEESWEKIPRIGMSETYHRGRHRPDRAKR
jgi:predicted transcriptional regulator